MGEHELLKAARQALQKGEYGEAESHLYPLIEGKTPFADVYSLMGVAQYHQGRFGKAVAYFEKALAKNAHYAEALLYLSVIYCDLGHYDKGKKRSAHLHVLPTLKGHLAIASPFRARLANMHAEIADLYRGLGCSAEAIFEYDRALVLEPGYPDIRLKRALALRMADRVNPEVAKELKAVIKTHPGYLVAYLELGISYYLKGQWAEAKAAWQALLKRDPKNKNAQVYLHLLERKRKESRAGAREEEKNKNMKKNTQHFSKRSDKGDKKASHKAKRK